MKKLPPILLKGIYPLLYLVILFSIILSGYLFYLSHNLPSTAELIDPIYELPTELYDRNGKLITKFFTKNRVLIPLNKVPQVMIKALLAIEDARFYYHHGIDPIRIIGAFFADLKTLSFKEGASTLTQQTAKMFLLDSDKKIVRKLKEILLALKIEHKFSKNKILWLYLNKSFFGHNAYGIEAASRSYFSKTAEELTLPEAALLAGILQAPSRWSPTRNKERATQRRDIVLRQMRHYDAITEEELQTALKTPIKLKLNKNIDNNETSYYVENVRKTLLEKYGFDQLYHGGMKVYVAMELQQQIYAQHALIKGLYKHDRRQGYRGPLGNLWKEVNSELKLTVFGPRRGLSSARFAKLSPELQQKARTLYNKKQKLITQKNHYIIGGELKGVVYRVDKKLAYVDIGDFKEQLDLAYLKWARPVNYTTVNNGSTRLRDLRDILKAGDIIELKIIDYNQSKREFVLELTQKAFANGALISIDPKTGHVYAMTGGINFRDSEFNRATQSKRQPGSAFKPIVYSLALDSSFTTASMLSDAPLNFKDTDWTPSNYSKTYKGQTTLRNALVHSKNIPTIRLTDALGIDAIIKHARKLGMTAKLPKDLTIGLGTASVTLEEMVRTYGIFANGGYLVKPVYILKVIDRNGKILEEHKVDRGKQVLSEQNAFLITDILTDVVRRGSGWRARAVLRPAAGKTGTTNNFTDAWFIGYVPQLLTGVYVGFDDNRKSLGDAETGSRAAAPIWVDFMSHATASMDILPFKIPKGIHELRINPESGELDCTGSKNATLEFYKTGTEPTTCHKENNQIMEPQIDNFETTNQKQSPDTTEEQISNEEEL